MNRWTGARLALVASLAALGITLNGTPASAISILAHVRVPDPKLFDTQVELQGLYDEITEVYGPGMTSEDISMFDQVVYAPDWVFVDANGRTLTRAEMNARKARAPEPDSVINRIEKLAAVPGGLTALVTGITVHTFVDTDGRYGRPGASHTITEVTPYRDSWVQGPTGWTMTERQQVGPTKSVLDNAEWDM
jgi:hypothetical protein